MSMGKIVTSGGFGATGHDGLGNCAHPSVPLRVPLSPTSQAVSQNFDDRSTQRSAVSYFRYLQRKLLVEPRKPLVPAGNVLFGFEQLNRQIRELEPPVTSRKQSTGRCLNRQKTQKRTSEFSSVFIFPKARSFSLDGSHSLLNEGASR
jgi:hypothetical protein